jgi:hypothetical protein
MGSQSGVLGSVKWDKYEELARMDNNSHSTNSIDAILPYDPTTVITGCSDGIIRSLSFFFFLFFFSFSFILLFVFFSFLFLLFFFLSFFLFFFFFLFLF